MGKRGSFQTFSFARFFSVFALKQTRRCRNEEINWEENFSARRKIVFPQQIAKRFSSELETKSCWLPGSERKAIKLLADQHCRSRVERPEPGSRVNKTPITRRENLSVGACTASGVPSTQHRLSKPQLFSQQLPSRLHWKSFPSSFRKRRKLFPSIKTRERERERLLGEGQASPLSECAFTHIFN